MSQFETPDKKVHQGRNIKRFREMLGIKQEAFAYELGDDWNQKKVSLLEQRETIETNILTQVAAILKIPVQAIENFDEEQAMNIISNTLNDNSTIANNNTGYLNCSFNPIDKIVELYDEKIVLYERMLKEKEEMMAELKELLKNK